MSKLFFLLALVPVIELYLLIQIGGWLGFLPTVMLVLGSGMLGASLARREGRRVLQEWQQVLSRGRVPEEGLLSAALVVVGGLLLVTPGVLTDVVGLLLLFPLTRRVISNRVRRHLERAIARGTVRVSRAHLGGVPPGARHSPARDGSRSWPRGAGRDAESDAEIVAEPPARLSPDGQQG